MSIKGNSGFTPLTAAITAGSIGPIVKSGKYQISCTGETVYLRQSTAQADALTVTAPSGSVRGLELFGGNSLDMYLDAGDYIGVITATGTAAINVHFARGF